jgi:hypothetical protein
MNTYHKFCPNVFLAKCEEQYQKGDIIQVETKYGKENACIVHNYMGTKNGFFFYSITREDGTNAQTVAQKRLEKLEGYAGNADIKSNQAWEASHEGRDFLSLGEPIKVGHHSEHRHRALIERNHNRMAKSVELADKAEEYRQRAEYWAARTDIVNLSMPESIEYFEFKLEEALKTQQGLKDGSIPRCHSFSLPYATKEVKTMKENLELAKKLWA